MYSLATTSLPLTSTKSYNGHPRILHAINYGLPFDVGVVMCRALDLNLRSSHFLVFPSTITEICQAARVDMHCQGDQFVHQARPISSRICNKLARDRELPCLDSMEISEDDQESSDNGTDAITN